VSIFNTYGQAIWTLPYVSIFDTGCVDFRHGILFFATASAGPINEEFAIPFFKVPGWRMCPVREFGEAIVCGDTAAIGTKKTLGGLAQEAEMFVLRMITHNRARCYADGLSRVAVG
jgi:hypothetical protein